MIHLSKLRALLIAALALPATGQSSIAPSVERATRGTAHVAVLFGDADAAVRVQRASSGIVLDPRGLVLTNDHLVGEIAVDGGEVGEEFWLKVVIGGGRSCPARLIARDERLDLALLQLELEEGELIRALELAPDAAPAPGTEAIVIGVPGGGHRFAYAGVVDLANGPVLLGEGTLAPGEVLLYDAMLGIDVDGGPFVDRAGRVLGIANTSPRQRQQPDSEEDAEELANEPDYAVVVSAAAIRAAFPDAFDDGSTEERAEEVTAALVEQIGGAVVSVWAGAADAARPEHAQPTDPHGSKPEEGLGSGVIVDPGGLLWTSAATVGDATELGVRLLDGRTFRADLVKKDVVHGIALVQIELPEDVTLEAVELGSSDGALAGEQIAVVGNPYGHALTVSGGVLAAREVDERLRIGAWIHDGHKGGAVVDVTGRLIGIAAADIHEGAEPARPESYLGVAVPVDRLRESFAAELAEHGSAPSLSAAPEATEEELARRSNGITAIVASTRDSLLNVEVSAEVARPESFDPFATRGEFQLLGQGSGAVIDESGLALTNWHVVDAALAPDGSQRDDRSVEVTLPSGKRYTARVLSTSRDDDLGLIQLEIPEGDQVQPVLLGDSSPMRLGDVVVAIGNPFGKANTVTRGIVTAKDQDTKIQGRLHIYQDMLQTDAAINPGNSGGALLDLEGRLVGINSAGSSGVGLAIPVERVREVFGAKLLSAQQLRSVELGMSVGDDADGVLVRGIEEHGPAQRAGIEVGDRVLSFGGTQVENAIDVSLVLLSARAWEPLRLELEREGQPLELEATPVSHAAWRIFRQTGIELGEVDYRTESALVRDASVELHRAYTGLPDALPRNLMSGALRVVQVQSTTDPAPDIQPGDLLLGASALVRTVDSEHAELVRFESLSALRAYLEPLATPKGAEVHCWLLRDGAVRTARIQVVKVR